MSATANILSKPPGHNCPPKSLSETKFTSAFRVIDKTATALIAEGSKASKLARRLAAEIVVEGVRLSLASEAATDEWSDLAKRELTDRGVKVNAGHNFYFRTVANVIFRGVTKVKDDAELADSLISGGQISRYAQAMAWGSKKHKSGTPLASLAGEIEKLGGMRKVADLWSQAQSGFENKATISPDAESGVDGNEATDPAQLATPLPNSPSFPLRLIGVIKLEEAIVTPVIGVIYPDGKVSRAPLAPETMTTMVAQWEASE